jgi:hypothetical protein
VLALKFVSVAACGAPDASSTSPAAAVHPFNFMAVLSLDAAYGIAE